MTLPTSAHLGTPAPTLESVAPDSASIDGRLDRLARGSAFGALLLLALALLALGFTSHHSDEALDAITDESRRLVRVVLDKALFGVLDTTEKEAGHA